MPVSRKDKHSGAIIYDLTSSELEVKELQNTVVDLASTVNSLKKQIQDLQVTSNAGSATS